MNPAPTSPLADDLATAPSGLIQLESCPGDIVFEIYTSDPDQSDTTFHKVYGSGIGHWSSIMESVCVYFNIQIGM